VDGTIGVAVSDLTIDGQHGRIQRLLPGYVASFTVPALVRSRSTHVTPFTIPWLGCQAVLGIFVQIGQRRPGAEISNVAIQQNMVDDYGRTESRPRAGTFVTVSNNMVTGRGATGLGDAAQTASRSVLGARVGVRQHHFGPRLYPARFCGVRSALLPRRRRPGALRAHVRRERAEYLHRGGGPSSNSPLTNLTIFNGTTSLPITSSRGRFHLDRWEPVCATHGVQKLRRPRS